MADNLKQLTTNVDTVIPINGGVSSVKTANHNPFEKEIIGKVGKMTGFPYTSKRSPIDGVVPNGSMFWNATAMNNETNFDIYLGLYTLDGNRIDRVLENIINGSIIHFKDFSGRSTTLKFISYIIEQDTTDTDYVILTVQGFSENTDYAYQVGDLETCMLEFSEINNIKIVSNVQELINSKISGSLYYLSGYYEQNDGGEGYFYFNPENEIAEDLGLIFDHENLDGSFIRIYDNNSVSVKWFGAKGDAVYDEMLDIWNGNNDTERIGKCVDTGKSIFFPTGVYKILSEDVPNIGSNRGFHLESNITIFGEGKEKTSIVMDGVVNGTESTYFGMFNVIDKENIEFRDLEIRGRQNAYEEHLTFSYASQGIYIFGTDCKNIKVDKCKFRYMIGHGVQDNSGVSGNIFTYNEASFCSQNGLNINTKNSIIKNNFGSFNGFGLLECASGNSVIRDNEAFDNYQNGITIGGYNDVDNNEYGDNNIISGNKCYRNENIGLAISMGVRESIISHNISYKNGAIGVNCIDDETIYTNNTFIGNTVYDNGFTAGTGLGIYVNSNGNTFIGNNVYNTSESDDYVQKFGFSVSFEKGDKQTFINNKFNGHTNFDIELIGATNTNYVGFSTDKISLIGDCSFISPKRSEIIAYNSFPVSPLTDFLTADNASSSKSAILPKAEFYPKGKILTIYDDKGLALINNITINPNGSDNIIGLVTPLLIDANFGSLRLISDSIDNWIIL